MKWGFLAKLVPGHKSASGKLTRLLQGLHRDRDTQFSGSICPDHMPYHPDDPSGFQAFAFGYGYVKALIQAVNSEVLGSY